MKSPCHVCACDTLEIFPAFAQLRRVTSDCKPWPAGGQLGVCAACGCVQAAIDERWRAEADQIYRDYTIYYQSGGTEQSVFDQTSGTAATRSDRLVARLAEQVELPTSGRWLDVGCGNGGFLGSFARRFPAWTLAGVEYDAKYRTQVEAIPGVERLYTGDLAEVPGEFDAISLIHVLEHIENPRRFLASVQAKLRPGGWLIVELPHYADNPFELLIADHATHYGLETASALLEREGFRLVQTSDCWIPKELTLVARNEAPVPGRVPAAVREAGPMLGWLAAVVADGRRFASEAGRFGLFGTSIAGTWLYGELADAVQFFVDEDPGRVGGEHFGRPIQGPAEVPAGSEVYVGLPPKIARAVVARLSRAGVRYRAAPELP